MSAFFYIFIGGGLGTILRYLVSLLARRYTNGPFPWGTLLVNVTGSLFIGCLWYLFDKTEVSSNVKFFMLIGMLGAFTTFSTYSLDFYNLIKSKEIKLAIVYILANNCLSLVMVFAGIYASKTLLRG